MTYNFDEILANIDKAKQYKRNHYYDNYSGLCLDEIKTQPDIYIIDKNGRKGTVTGRELALIAELPRQTIESAIEALRGGKGLSKALNEKLNKKGLEVNLKW